MRVALSSSAYIGFCLRRALLLSLVLTTTKLLDRHHSTINKNYTKILSLQIERYPIHYGSCTSDVFQLTNLSGFRKGPDNGDSIRLRLIGLLLSMCFWSEAHFIKDGLRELIDVTIRDVPEVRDQSWAVTVKSIENSN